MDSIGAEFGTGFHEFVTRQWDIFGFLTPFIHVLTILVLALVFIYGNRFRKLFVIFFTFEWIFLFGYWGVYGIIFWIQKGLNFLAMYGIAPILLGLIIWQWIKELFNNSFDLDFNQTIWWKWIVLLVALWGFGYPEYIYGQGFIFDANNLLFSYFGLMPCPTIMVVLSIMTLTYPRGNRVIFNLFTAYAIFIGIGSVAAGWLPDIPFIILGFYSLGLILFTKSSTSRHSLT